MIILKAQLITTGAQDMATFINKNNIKKEDIISIAVSGDAMNNQHFTIFFYGDSETTIIKRGFIGWD